ncbi:DUF544-domain-containing protein [Rickenella mellea]|uniref:DUF544-domain-containing protein n=1 Tax=Rickenella mellea TaxID=50990 RepID=A0A4Y7QF62_9AGAM|nr:DUF544-domain-containing protein [Rickenella mellea]
MAANTIDAETTAHSQAGNGNDVTNGTANYTNGYRNNGGHDDHDLAIQNSRQDAWFLKEILFEGTVKKIVTQNHNGPCSFIAICNILILRGDIEILPPERTHVSYDFLAQLVGEYLLRASPDVDLSAALSMMPLTQKGMDLNPRFTGLESFHPAGDAGALKLFEQARIRLVHGWLVDPDSPEHRAVAQAGDYDDAVNRIVEADALTKGMLVTPDDSVIGGSARGSGSGASGSGSGSAPSGHWTPEERRKIEDALVIRTFLDTTSSQLTYYGLFTLASSLPPGSLVALFRGSHLAVLHKPSSKSTPTRTTNGVDSNSTEPGPSSSSSPRPDPQANGEPTPSASPPDGGLYTLVTDHVFRNEPSVVWERVEDVDGGSSSFVDGNFMKASPAGGDFAGYSAESTLAALEAEMGQLAVVDPADQELARQLQAEEDAHAAQMFVRRDRERMEHHARQHQRRQERISDQQQSETGASGMKKKKSCIIQ